MISGFIIILWWVRAFGFRGEYFIGVGLFYVFGLMIEGICKYFIKVIMKMRNYHNYYN
jgi:hypothetical protein